MLIRTGRRTAIIVVGWLAIAWVGCDSITDPPEPAVPLLLSDTATKEIPPVNPSLGPDPSALLPASASAATTASAMNVTFVSLPPGTVPNGEAVTIRNQSGGDAVSLPMVDGGFDPVPVEAKPGDLLVLEIRVAGGSGLLTLERRVPVRRPPKVVRTNPPPKKRDVALNASIIIVFSEPIDATTLTEATVQLRRGATIIAGRVELRDADGLTVAFVPAAPLAAENDYELLLTQGIHDRDGESLEGALTVPFTTRALTSSVGASVLRVPQDVATIQEAVDGVRSGGVVLVEPGVYREGIEINRGVTIERSTEPGEVRIVPPAGTVNAINVTTAEPVVLRRLTIDHLGLEPGKYSDAGNIGIFGSGPAHIHVLESTILHANLGVVVENDSASSGGLAQLIVRSNTFDGGDPPRMETSVLVATDVAASLERNTVRRTLWSCIQVQGTANTGVMANDVDMCGVAGGIRVWVPGTVVYVGGNTVRNTTRSGSRFGIFFGGGNGIIERNSVVDYVQPHADAAWSPAAIRLRDAAVVVRFNDLSGNAHAGVRNTTPGSVDATCNWWGAADGPSGDGGGRGDAVVGAVTFIPFATEPIVGAAGICSGHPPDATQLAFTAQPTTTVAGRAMAPALRVTARDAQGNIAPTFTGSVTVALGSNPGGSTLGGSITTTAVNGIATFYDLRLDRPGTGYVLTASAAGLASATSAAFDVIPRSSDVVYFNDFESAPGVEWSHRRRNTVPNERYPAPSFLGEFGCFDSREVGGSATQAEQCLAADTVTLTLSGLPAHDELTISFDLYLIGTWDGNPRVYSPTDNRFAPDLFNASVIGGPTLLNATFSIHPERPYQSYPAQYPMDGSAPANNPRHTGALAIDALGYKMDAVYRLTFTFPHASPTVIFRFTAPVLEHLNNEAWGLDNVEVSARRR